MEFRPFQIAVAFAPYGQRQPGTEVPVMDDLSLVLCDEAQAQSQRWCIEAGITHAISAPGKHHGGYAYPPQVSNIGTVVVNHVSLRQNQLDEVCEALIRLYRARAPGVHMKVLTHCNKSK